MPFRIDSNFLAPQNRIDSNSTAAKTELIAIFAFPGRIDSNFRPRLFSALQKKPLVFCRAEIHCRLWRNSGQIPEVGEDRARMGFHPVPTLPPLHEILSPPRLQSMSLRPLSQRRQAPRGPQSPPGQHGQQGGKAIRPQKPTRAAEKARGTAGEGTGQPGQQRQRGSLVRHIRHVRRCRNRG